MAFTMRCCANNRDRGLRRRRAARIAALLLGLAVAAPAPADPGILVDDASNRLVNDIYVVDADITYELSEEAREALDHGVPLSFTVEIEFKERRDYLWDEVVASNTQRLRLEYHALSRSYLVSNLTTRTRRSFPTLEDALKGMGEMREVAVSERRFLRAGAPEEGRIRALLDIEALPAPLRPAAYLSPQWRLRSKWKRWTITP